MGIDIDRLAAISDETERVNALYANGAEETRLTGGQASRVEWLTTMRLLREYIRPGMRVLDLGAGTGAYSVALADMGCGTDAVELAEKNAELLRAKITPERRLRVFRRSACDLSIFPDGSYDAVLVFGPLYHLEKAADRAACIREALRVCKADGTLFFAFISNDMVPLTECRFHDFFSLSEPHTYDHQTFQMENIPFVFFTLDQMRTMLRENGVALLREVASDGASELLGPEIDAMSEESYGEYLRYHFHCCEKPEMLGCSNHLLFAGKKA